KRELDYTRVPATKLARRRVLIAQRQGIVGPGLAPAGCPGQRVVDAEVVLVVQAEFFGPDMFLAEQEGVAGPIGDVGDPNSRGTLRRVHAPAEGPIVGVSGWNIRGAAAVIDAVVAANPLRTVRAAHVRFRDRVRRAPSRRA